MTWSQMCRRSPGTQMTNGQPDSTYTVPAPVNDPARFYGRKAEVESFFNRLSGAQLDTMMILGAPQSGKTSFLKYVSNPAVYRPKLKKPSYVAYVDLQAVRDTCSFFSAVTRGVCAALADQPGSAGPPEPRSSSEFVDWLQNVGKARRLAILLDRFETLLGPDSAFDDIFFAFLRSFCQGQLVWITASDRPGPTLTRYQRTANRNLPVSEVLSYPIYLGALEDEAAQALIYESAVALTRDEVLAVQRLAGGFPCILPATAQHWSMARRRGVGPENCYDTVLDELLSPDSVVHRHFGTWWRGQERAETRLIRDAATRDLDPARVDKRDRSRLVSLEKYGFLAKIGRTYRLRGDAFRYWVSGK